mmetsp:Transcript_78483/g.199635  ORF Transcript_78483/g.199635 Transcript_78483/m.199635 type:complete len:214 (-) Transcript_78483:1031-1672(-)
MRCWKCHGVRRWIRSKNRTESWRWCTTRTRRKVRMRLKSRQLLALATRSSTSSRSRRPTRSFRTAQSEGSTTPPWISTRIFQKRWTKAWASSGLLHRFSSAILCGATGFLYPSLATKARTLPRCTSSTTFGSTLKLGVISRCMTSTISRKLNSGRSGAGWSGRTRGGGKNTTRRNAVGSCGWQRRRSAWTRASGPRGRLRRPRSARRRKPVRA